MELSKKEIIEILKSNDKSIFKTADEVRREYVGDGIHLRGLIEFSNICKRNCLRRPCLLLYKNIKMRC